jgi:LPS sulfotransferase NodH
LIIAATPRSGSTLLSRLIDTTGPFLLTEEYFNDGKYRTPYGLTAPTVTRKLEEIDRRSRSESNMISVKLFPPHMEQILPDDTLGTAFSNAHYVFLVRHDLLRQAISLYRASATEQWLSSMEDQGRTPEYDERAIGAHMAEIADWNRWWQLFFAVRNVPVHYLTYDALEADPATEVAKVMSFLGFDPQQHPADLSRLKIRRQRDELTEQWRERFLSGTAASQPELVQKPVPRTFRNAVRFCGKRLYA